MNMMKTMIPDEDDGSEAEVPLVPGFLSSADRDALDMVPAGGDGSVGINDSAPSSELDVDLSESSVDTGDPVEVGAGNESGVEYLVLFKPSSATCFQEFRSAKTEVLAREFFEDKCSLASRGDRIQLIGRQPGVGGGEEVVLEDELCLKPDSN